MNTADSSYFVMNIIGTLYWLKTKTWVELSNNSVNMWVGIHDIKAHKRQSRLTRLPTYLSPEQASTLPLPSLMR